MMNIQMNYQQEIDRLEKEIRAIKRQILLRQERNQSSKKERRIPVGFERKEKSNWNEKEKFCFFSSEIFNRYVQRSSWRTERLRHELQRSRSFASSKNIEKSEKTKLSQLFDFRKLFEGCRYRRSKCRQNQCSRNDHTGKNFSSVIRTMEEKREKKFLCSIFLQRSRRNDDKKSGESDAQRRSISRCNVQRQSQRIRFNQRKRGFFRFLPLRTEKKRFSFVVSGAAQRNWIEDEIFGEKRSND